MSDIFVGFGHFVIGAVAVRALLGEIPVSWGVAGALVSLAVWSWGLVVLGKKVI